MTLGETSALDLAMRRLERAVTQLEQRLAARPSEGRGGALAAADPDLFDSEAVRLKAQLEEARQRERVLEEAGVQASVALGRAIAEIRAALGDDAATANDDGSEHDVGDAPQTGELTDELFDEPGKA